MLAQVGRPVSVGAYPAFDLSFFYYERNQLEKAEACLREVREHAQRWQDMNLLVWSYGAYVKVLLAAGKLVAAEQAVGEARHIVQRTGLTVYEATIQAARAGDAAGCTGANHFHLVHQAAPRAFRAGTSRRLAHPAGACGSGIWQPGSRRERFCCCPGGISTICAAKSPCSKVFKGQKDTLYNGMSPYRRRIHSHHSVLPG
jgi:hypothetical protein